ncbi:MAG: ATP-dependent DNA helicase RecG [Lachnospiraceae bacterium]|nr:ATP-dependent DNA helicase RecG [Lachnospiraceae bacterium]
MRLEEIPEKKLKKLNDNGIDNIYDLCYLFPYKYYDFSEARTLSLDIVNKYSLFYGEIKSVEVVSGTYRNKKMVQAGRVKMKLDVSGTTLYVTYIGNYYMGETLKRHIGSNLYVGGKISLFNDKYYCMLNPVMTTFDERELGIKCVYPKYAGIGEDYLRDLISETIEEEKIVETLPLDVLTTLKLPNKEKSINYIHNPSNITQLQSGVKRQLYEDLVYFACSLERENRLVSNNSPFVVKNFNYYNKICSSLPFDLTSDQKSTIEALMKKAAKGERINALIQGDVGCGKSIVAFLLMLVMAENGYQAAMMAPTLILAEQHYKELSSYASLVGKRVAFIGGKQKAKERKEILSGIENGEYDLVVGTHSLISDKVVFKNLGMSIVDEEHRFGVRQREALVEKAKAGVHTIKFSATPIPRTLASNIFSGNDIYEIKTMPAGRKGIETTIVNSDNDAISKIKEELDKGSQAYVVCPLIETEDGKQKSSVNAIAELYKEKLGVEVACVTGKMTKEAVTENLKRFKDGEVKVLVATTVVEVGVNVPNATVMVIEDAYNFGLAGLHQLRGRVGRGNKKGYCILNSDRDSERLNIMCKTTDGFVIAEEDMKLRGAGDLLGSEQSGSNRFLEEALLYPNMFKNAKAIAKKMVDNDSDDLLIREMEKRNDKVYFKLKKWKVFA